MQTVAAKSESKIEREGWREGEGKEIDLTRSHGIVCHAAVAVPEEKEE